MTPLHDDASAIAPCTRTIVGLGEVAWALAGNVMKLAARAAIVAAAWVRECVLLGTDIGHSKKVLWLQCGITL